MSEKLSPQQNRRRLAVLAFSILAIPVLAELGLRWILFGSDPLAVSLGETARHPAFYANPHHDEDFWLLRSRFNPAESSPEETGMCSDTLLGWRSKFLEGPDYVHRMEADLGDRRPVLFFGASFVVPDYSRKLEQSELGATHSLLHFSSGGYGLGQVWLLQREIAPRFADREPLTILAIVVNTDLCRAGMALRESSKPSFRLDENGEVVHIPCACVSPGEIADGDASHISSYLFAWLRGIRSPLGFARAAANRRAGVERREDLVLNQAIIEQIRSVAQANGSEFMVALFGGPKLLAKKPVPVEVGLIGFLEEQGIPYVNGRKLFAAAAQAGYEIEDLHYPKGHVGENHPNMVGRSLIFEMLKLAITGHRDRTDDGNDVYRSMLERWSAEHPLPLPAEL